ncbi:helix-turn-helix domain-containing protein [Propionibacteriaceae bacterium G1746]|uniref:helix-turn-helix domain-containing protein n=1 Tax=Aestuariimicrobium sp. G57 TaxID=3418485 RepID=UPI003C16A290
MLKPEELLTRSTYDTAAPAPALAPWVEHYWSVAWQLPPGERAHRATVWSPTVHLTVERGGVSRADTDGQGVWFTGPGTEGRFDVTLSGRGSVVGVKFRPGGVLAFVPVDLVSLLNRTVPAAEVFPETTALHTIPDDAATAAHALDAWLLAQAPVDTRDLVRFREIWQLAETQPITTVAELALHSGCSPRTIQRLFRHHVGGGAKRVLLRRRVSEALEAIDRGGHDDWAGLAAELGWFDQAHFIRDFRRVTGHTPADYAERGGGGSGEQ